MVWVRQQIADLGTVIFMAGLFVLLFAAIALISQIIIFYFNGYWLSFQMWDLIWIETFPNRRGSLLERVYLRFLEAHISLVAGILGGLIVGFGRLIEWLANGQWLDGRPSKV